MNIRPGVFAFAAMVGFAFHAHATNSVVAEGKLTQPSQTPHELALTLPAMPPTRTTCEVLGTLADKTDFSARLQWDPVQPSSLRQTVTIPALADGTAPTIACYADALRPTLKPECNFGWTFDAALNLAADDAQAAAAAADAVANVGAAPTAEQSSQAWINAHADTCKADPARSDIRIAVTYRARSQAGLEVRAPGANGPTSTLRSVGGVPDEIIQDAFTAIAAVITDRVKGAALREIQAALLDEFDCEDTSGKPQRWGLQFTHLCSALRHVRLDQLSSVRGDRDRARRDAVRLCEEREDGALPSGGRTGDFTAGCGAGAGVGT